GGGVIVHVAALGEPPPHNADHQELIDQGAHHEGEHRETGDECAHGGRCTTAKLRQVASPNKPEGTDRCPDAREPRGPTGWEGLLVFAAATTARREGEEMFRGLRPLRPNTPRP